MTDLLLAIDQGTTGTTVALFDVSCNMIAKVNTEFRQIFPKPGWVEHDLDDIWNSVEQSIQSCLETSRMSPKDIKGIGITNQRETTGIWNRKTAKPVHNAIVWQCRRTAPFCLELKESGAEEIFRNKTGLVLDPYFSGTKVRWLLDNVQGLRKQADSGELCFGTMDTFLVYKLTAGKVHITDVSNASRTLMMDLDTLDWDNQLLDLLGVPDSILPQIRSSSEIYGYTSGLEQLPDGIPICGIAGDQQAALFGQACFDPGSVKCTYGTGAFVLMNTGDRKVLSERGLLTTVAWKLGHETSYALEGSVFIAGAAVQWLRDGLGIIDSSQDVETLASSVDSSQGVVFVPALAGLGAPHWNPHARGIISGITRGTTKAHLARATLEGIAFQVRDVVEAMRQDSNESLSFFRVDGGAAQNDLLLQFQSDILSVELHRPKVIETTAAGAAMLAGLAVGVWKDLDDIRKNWSMDKRFQPEADADTVQQHLDRWRSAIQKA